MNVTVSNAGSPFLQLGKAFFPAMPDQLWTGFTKHGLA
jgi:hypothetical protein